MKFLCDNCKSKYQIPDEKISGRTLRMKCRKCGHNIIIRGDQTEAQPAAGSSSASGSGAHRPSTARRSRRRGSSSSVAPRPRGASPLSGDFRSGELAEASSERSAPSETEWHVAVNDVPVGPIKRAEVARKVGSGAVTGESLVWREGFDDWLPLRDVAELVGLLEQRRIPAPPSREGSRPRIAPVPPPPVAPIGGRMGASVPPVEDFDDDEATKLEPMVSAAALGALPASPAAAPPKPAPAAPPPPVAAATATSASSPGFQVAEPSESVPMAAFAAAPAAPASEPPPRRALPIGAIIAMVGAAAFGIAFAIVLASKMLDDGAPAAPAVAANTETTGSDPTPLEPPTMEPEVVEPTMDADDGSETVEGTESTEGNEDTSEMVAATPMATSMHTTHTGASHAATTTMTESSAMEPELTDAQRRALERLTMGGSSNVGGTTAMIDVAGSGNSQMRTPLDANALRRVVNRNRIQMQRCYERAIRGLSDPPGGRFDISIRVGSTGRISNVDVSGPDIGNLKQCLRTTVGRWSFPGTSGGEASFPLVLSAGG